jgi:hypothetical protein
MHGPDLVRAFERPTAWPRAFFTSDVQRYEGVDELIRRLRSASQPFAVVLASDGEALEATAGLVAPSQAVVRAEQYHLTPNTTTFSVRAPGPGVAVLGEAFLADDFRATLNGESVAYFRVNHVFKGVRIPGAGNWTIRFEYQPRRWTLALILAAGGGSVFGAMVIAAIWPVRRDRFRRTSPVSAADSALLSATGDLPLEGTARIAGSRSQDAASSSVDRTRLRSSGHDNGDAIRFGTGARGVDADHAHHVYTWGHVRH